jgi:predicted peptidase
MRRRVLWPILALAAAASGQTVLFGQNEHVKSVTAITEVYGDGQKVSAAAVEYDRDVLNAALSPSIFSVEGRTVSRIYANTAPAKADAGTDGRYVIIELARPPQSFGGRPGGGAGGPGGPAAPGAPRGPGGPGIALGGPNAVKGPRAPLKAAVRQTGEITVVGGQKYPPTAAPMESTRTVNLVVDDFRQFTFKDRETGLDLMYNLYIPKNYDPKRSYPMVLFIHDAGQTSGEVTTTLTQGLGAVIWATPSEQAKHEAFVLAPQYSRGAVVNDNSEYSSDLDVTVRLVEDVAGRYGIDRKRIYTTGQSMGCMLSIAMQIQYPDLFAASLLVAGQWDPQKMKALAHKNMWILVAEGDTKAFPGMTAATAAMEEAGGKVSRARWNARAGEAEMAANVKKMIGEGANIKFVAFEKGTVFPEGVAGGMEHMQTWVVAYSIEGSRDWLFTQVKR